jgi:hypothetical protein
MEGLALAHQWFELPVLIQTDCAEAITAMKCTRKNRSAYGHLIDEIKHLLKLRDNVRVKIECDHIRVAHCLANVGKTGESTILYFRTVAETGESTILYFPKCGCNPIIEE